MRAFRHQTQAASPEADLLPPDRARRRIERAPSRPSSADVIDAQFVVIRETLRAAPQMRAAPAGGGPKGFIRQRLAALEARLQRLSEVSFALIVAIAFVSIFSIAGKIAFGGSDAAALDARPLDLTHVNLTPQDRNGMRVLLISAIVENRSKRAVDLPRVRADLLIAGQVIASTYVEPPVDTLEAGQSRGLAARLQHPGGKTPELRLSFEAAGA